MAKKVIVSLPDLGKARMRVDKPNLINDEVAVSELVKNFAQGKKYFIKTFGCQANVRDEEVMGGYLEKAGYSKTTNPSEADIAIINTCAVRENAEEKVYGEIGRFKANHQADKDFVLAICGCMMQEEGVAESLISKYPYINIVFGTHNIHMLLDLLEGHIKTNKDYIDVLSYSGDIVENLPSTRLDSHKAYVNITYGCDKFCTYCIVPYTRGRERSRAKEKIIEECRELVEDGYKEITLLGQNVNSYGKDFHDGTDFASILEEVAKLGIPRLRFMTSHPWDFTDDMLDVIAKYPNIMKCIHLPVQSGSDVVLRRMGRRYSREEYLDLVRRIRAKIPGCAITTDIIVGFPDETEEDFEATLSLAEEVDYDAAFTFIYSPRKGTPAAKMKDDVGDELKHSRFDRLIKVIEKSVESHAEAMVGKTYEVLVDGPSKKDGNLLSGYTESSKLVHFKGPRELKGHIVPVRIVESHTFSLIGELEVDPIIVLTEELSSRLGEEEAVTVYRQVKKAFDEDEGINALKEKLTASQKAMSMALRDGDDEIYTTKKKEYLSLKEKYESHPLYLNLVTSASELTELLEEVMEGLK